MTGFNHALSGAVIALVVKEPFVALPLAFLSHYLLDMLPHQGFSQEEVLGNKFKKVLKADFLFSISLMAFLGLLFPEQKWLIWSCMIAAALPDLVWFFHRKTVKQWPRGLDRLTKLHWRVNNHVRHFYFDILYFFVFLATVLLICF